MKYYIQTGECGREKYYLNDIVKNKCPNLHNENLNKQWVNYALNIIDDLATDFNLYAFFNQTTPNMPSRFLFIGYAESLLGLSKLLDKRRKNKLCIVNILNSYEQNIKDKDTKSKFLLYKKDIMQWLDSQKDFIDNLKIVRDEFLAHLDIEENKIKEWHKAIDNIEIDKFLEVANTTIEIYNDLITSTCRFIIPDSRYKIDEFNLIYECLRSLDKIDKNIGVKNCIIHNIDLELKQIEKLIK